MWKGTSYMYHTSKGKYIIINYQSEDSKIKLTIYQILAETHTHTHPHAFSFIYINNRS